MVPPSGVLLVPWNIVFQNLLKEDHHKKEGYLLMIIFLEQVTEDNVPRNKWDIRGWVHRVRLDLSFLKW